MRRSRFSEEKIIASIQRHEKGEKIDDICCDIGISPKTFFIWRKKYSGLEVQEVKRLKSLEEENSKLKRLVADLDLWCSMHGIKLHFIDPGKPVQNAYVESFNGKFREECLNQNHFMSLLLIQAWREEYNHVRPHSALKGLTPYEFAKQKGGTMISA